MAANNATAVPQAYYTSAAVPDWLNKGDNAWQMISATLVGLQTIPGLVILYGSIVKKKWAVNSAFMALYAFAAVVLCWVAWAYKMSFGDRLLPFWGRAVPPWAELPHQSGQQLCPPPSTASKNGAVETAMVAPYYPMASMVWFQCVFAAITVVLVAGSVLGRMNIKAWMMFVPMWVTFSYTVGAFSLWGGGFLFHWGVMDYSGGYVIHLSSGIAGITAAYWVGPRSKVDRERFPPNNVVLMLAGGGCGWGGRGSTAATVSANIDSSMAVLNTNICAATTLSRVDVARCHLLQQTLRHWCRSRDDHCLVCITPGLVQGWAALIMGILSGSVPWFTMMILHKKWWLLQAIDDTLGVFHTHAVAGFLGGTLTGLFAEPVLCSLFLPVTNSRGAVYGGVGGVQFVKQVVGGGFVIGWNVVVTSIICVLIRFVVPLRMPEEELLIGDDAVHGEEAYALWGDGEKYDSTKHGGASDDPTPPHKASSGATQVREGLVSISNMVVHKSKEIQDPRCTKGRVGEIVPWVPSKLRGVERARALGYHQTLRVE
ncbi:hypothetical protein DH2020_037844 [Rehmannia glutinosa]|uniref:Ammonium transporter AmtB-like domain-containing protein n=1 Tax=Rehmannia glutinosa TaxID=99300 RepID=A0ABR0V085_REHGL